MGEHATVLVGDVLGHDIGRIEQPAPRRLGGDQPLDRRRAHEALLGARRERPVQLFGLAASLRRLQARGEEGHDVGLADGEQRALDAQVLCGRWRRYNGGDRQGASGGEEGAADHRMDAATPTMRARGIQPISP